MPKPKKKVCSVCNKEKSIKYDFYKWRAQCISCYSDIRAVKYARSTSQAKTVEVDRTVPLKKQRAVVTTLYGTPASPNADAMREEIKQRWQ